MCMERSHMPIRISGMVSGLDTDSIVQELVSAYSKKTESYEKKKTTLEWKQDAWKDLNTKIYDLYSSTLGTLRFASAYNKRKTTVSDETKATVTASSSAAKGTQTLEVHKLATSGYLTGAELGGSDLSSSTELSKLGIGNTSITVQVGNGATKTISLSSDSKISDVVKQFREAGIDANFDAENKRFFLSSTSTGKDLDFKLGGDADALNKLGLSETAGAVKIDGEDAQIKLNGATFTSKTNNFNINGLSINIKETTQTGVDGDGKPIYGQVKLVTDTDVDGIYNTIKDFIGKYNALINEMDTLYNAKTAKGYEPLTDDEKDTMSDKEVEKWEEKIKESILRRDATLGSISSMMKTAMLKGFEVNGKTMSLSDFGIKTGNYFSTKDNEKNAFHIDGDPDDSTVSSNDNKLKAMIAADPDATADFFSQLSKNLYDELYDRMRSTTLSSAFTVYNDKQMTTEMDEYKKQISKWEDYVTQKEEYWFKKFTAMEKALSQLQSSTSALAGLLGS